MSVSPAFVPDAAHPAPEPFGYRPLSAIAAASAGGVPQKRIGRVLSEIAPALVALHGQGKVHGAISVHTVGLDEFGHAHLLVPALYPDHAGSMEPASCFSAVEQFDADPVQACGPWTDVYALCAVMCSLVSGSPPPHALARRAHDQYVPLATRMPRGYEQGFLATIDQGLSLAPSQRPPSVQALCERLGISYLPEVSETSIESRQGPAPSRVGRGPAQRPVYGGRRRRAAGMLAVAAGVLAVIGAWAWLNQDDIPDEGSSAVVVGLHSSGRRDVPPSYVSGGLSHSLSGNATGNVAGNAAGNAPGSLSADLSANSAAGRSDHAASPATGFTETAPLGPAGEARNPASTTPSPPPLASTGSQEMPADSPPPPSPSASSATRDGSQVAPGTGGAAPPPARPARVVVKVDIRPWGEIIVDGVRRGVSPPLKTLNLPAGRHTIEVRNADLPPYRVSLELKPGQPATLWHVFR